MLLALAQAHVLSAATPAPSTVSSDIATRLSELGTIAPAAVAGSELGAFGVLEAFYSGRSFAPVWADASRANTLLGVLRNSVTHGLDPADYHLTELERRWAELSAPGATSHQRAEFDVLMTDALIRYGYHLQFGKVDPEGFDSDWNMARRAAGFDPVAELNKVLAAPELAAAVEALAPSLLIYSRLRGELAHYRAVAGQGGWEALPAGETLRPGAKDSRVPALRKRLLVAGDLPAATQVAAEEDAESYGPELVDAVKQFQRRMGLGADGIVGSGTLAALNVPVEQRIEQLRLNLDRARVLLHDLPSEFVVVNIASQEVYFVRDRALVWSSRAQVGRDYRQTPEYRSEISYLVFNPTWTVPPGIIRNDILPAAKKDPASITRKGLKVLDSAGREVAPEKVDWSRYSSGNIPYTLRQDPGPDNALGRVKFMFPNPFAVYLHDTPSKSLFDKDSRLTSSGCVRVERPFELAELLLDDAVRWSRAKIDETVASDRLQNVTLTRKVPVLLVYWTAWIDQGGLLNFRADSYGRDAKWAKALAEPFSVRKAPIGQGG